MKGGVSTGSATDSLLGADRLRTVFLRDGVPPRRSLSLRLLLLTLAVVALVEVLVFLPGLARERRNWVSTRIVRAHIAALSAAPGSGGQLDSVVREELLRLSGTLAVTARESNGELFELRPAQLPLASGSIVLNTETPLAGLERAIAVLIAPANRVFRVTADSPLRNGTSVEFLAAESSLRDALVGYARGFLVLALPIALLIGAFVYFTALLVLVWPISRLTASIAAFRADPERTPPLDTRWLKSLPGGEIAIAARELAGMQRELRTALWRNARLAALGAAIAKVSHDLRNSLSPALMTAERLEQHADPAVRRAGATLLRAVDDAVELVSRMLDFAREVPPQLAIVTVRLADLVDEAAGLLAQSGIHVLDNRIDPSTEAQADRTLLLRVVSNLVRNASEAGASRVCIRLAATQPAGAVAIEIADNGPGLPPDVKQRLFRPFVTTGKEGGTGLGLAISADLMRAQGGGIALGSTGPGGTVFTVTMPTRKICKASGSAAGAAPEATAQPA